MINKVYFENKTIYYDLTYKNVKNINLRIKPDGSVHVSANRNISVEKIEAFIRAKADFILKALETFAEKAERPRVQYFSEAELRDVIQGLCETAYPYFEKRGVRYPQIKFRKMVSRWGSCHSTKGILTFSTHLMYAPAPCIEYVVLHEFTHFLVPNHSKGFYEELSKVCPQWKQYRKQLKEIQIR